MNNKKLLGLFGASLLTLLGCTGCPGENKDSDSQQASSSETPSISESYSQVEDVIGFIPQEVLDFNGEIDIVEYIVGQSGQYADIGAKGTYALKTEDIFNSYLAKYTAAAREFKKIAPGVKINFYYCSDTDYYNLVTSYMEQKGHLPHIMHPIDNFYNSLENGYAHDLSMYSDCEYYKSYNDVLMNDLNYGGFQVAFPTHYAPYGMFVNRSLLEKYSIVPSDDEEAYRDWVDTLDLETFVQNCKDVYSPNTNASFPHMFDYMFSCIYDDVYNNYLSTGEMDLDSEDVKELLDYENELYPYAAFEYPFVTKPNSGKEDDGFSDLKNWSVTRQFVEGKYVFDFEEPWNLFSMSNYAKEYGLKYGDIDFIPFPKQNSEANNNLGIGIGGVINGNLCPIGEDGEEKCYSATARTEMDVAAYFTMFANCDPRALKAESEIEYKLSDDSITKGIVNLPLIEKGFRFSWQDDEDVLEVLGGDPAEGYKDNYDFELALYLKVYNTYFDSTNSDEPDVVTMSNVAYGLSKILNIVSNEPDSIINYRLVPDKILEGTEEVDIRDEWDNRYIYYELGTPTYVSTLKADLSRIKDDINTKTSSAYAYFQEMVDMFYGEGNYDVLPKN